MCAYMSTQVKSEVVGCLEFMKFVYGVLGMTYRLELSTKPEKAWGDDALWDVAEAVSTHTSRPCRSGRMSLIPSHTRIQHIYYTAIEGCSQ